MPNVTITKDDRSRLSAGDRDQPAIEGTKAGRTLRVLALASYPDEAAATRYRITQLIKPLEERDIAIEFRPFLTHSQYATLYLRRGFARTSLGMLVSTARRAALLVAARSADVILLQREAMLFGPPVCEYILARLFRKPLVLDLDDATYVPYKSPNYGNLTRFLKCFGKTDDLIRWSRVVVCGNRTIADHAAVLGTRTVVIPTVVDTRQWRPAAIRQNFGPQILGWVGSHSTFRYLESIFPAIQQLARSYRFRLLIVGSGRDAISLPGVDVICRPWSLAREAADFREIDIGLYPIVEEAWSAGKSGFKAIQYLSLGIPYVVSPVGTCAEIGEAGTTHFTATTRDEWHDALARLLGDTQLRSRLGAAGRQHALTHYALSDQADRLADALRAAAGE